MGWPLRFLFLLIVGFGVIQLVPYGRDHDNPLSVKEPRWDASATRRLALGACLDCHSNVTSWPWYTSIAPVSWLTQRDVEEGRKKLNFSRWDQPQEASLRDVLEAIRGGEMPPLQYRLLHPAGRLSDAEKRELATGLSRTWERDPPGGA
jgi:hypothetical protein